MCVCACVRALLDIYARFTEGHTGVMRWTLILLNASEVAAHGASPSRDKTRRRASTERERRQLESGSALRGEEERASFAAGAYVWAPPRVIVAGLVCSVISAASTQSLPMQDKHTAGVPLLIHKHARTHAHTSSASVLSSFPIRLFTLDSSIPLCHPAPSPLFSLL